MRVDQAFGGSNQPDVAAASFAMPPEMRMRYDVAPSALADCVSGYAIYISDRREPTTNCFLPGPAMLTVLLDAGPVAMSTRNRLHVAVPQAAVWGPTSHAYRVKDDRVTLRQRASSARIDSAFAGASVSWAGGPLLVQAGALYAWHDVDTTRSLAGAGLGTVTASPDANGAQLFAEAGYALTTGTVRVTPFLRHAFTWSRVEAYAEAGGTGALTVARDRRDIGLASAGVRVDGSAPLGAMTFVPRLSIAYQRGYGDIDGVAVQRFAGTGPAFAVTGAGLGKDGVAVDGGFDLEVGRFGVGVGGFASTTERWGDYGGKVAIGFRF